MEVMLGKKITDLTSKYVMLNINCDKGLKFKTFDCSEDYLIDRGKSDNKFGEFSKFLLNSNFQVIDGIVEPSIIVEAYDTDNESSNISFEFTAQNSLIDSVIALVRTGALVSFKHNSKKIASNANFKGTSFFKDVEPVFLNKTISCSIKDVKVVGSSVVIPYEVDGVNYFFELFSLSSDGISLNDFRIIVSKEEFDEIKDFISYDNLLEIKDKVTFVLSPVREDRIDNFKLVPCVLSGLFSVRQIFSDISEAVSLFRNRNSFTNFNKSHEEVKRCGLRLDSKGMRWSSGGVQNLFDFKEVEDRWSDIKEFLAMIEFGPDKSFLNSNRTDVDKCQELLIVCNKVFREDKNFDFDSIKDEILILSLLIMKFIFMFLISYDDEVGSLWIPTNYGEEVVKLEVEDDGDVLVF